MATVFDEIKETPQTHVLIIGVGKYPYLNGGTKTKPQIFSYAKALGQLQSTTVSAKEFHSEVMDLHHKNAWISPLGSVELLCDGVEEATRANVEEAYFNWKQRANANPDNVAVFYYAGHGFGMPQEQYLVLSDFGKNPNNPWNACLPFSATRTAFHGCAAKTQIFFVDACRSVTSDTLVNTIVVPAVDVINNLQSECTHNLTVLAAAPNERAYGLKDKTSYFLGALLSGLRGFGADTNGPECIISTGDFPPNINTWLALEQNEDSSPQRCTAIINKPGSFLKLPGYPDVELVVDCEPTDALSLAKFSCVNRTINQSRNPDTVPWKVKVPAGIYKISADFVGKEYPDEVDFKDISPPGTKQTFKLVKEYKNA